MLEHILYMTIGLASLCVLMGFGLFIFHCIQDPHQLGIATISILTLMWTMGYLFINALQLLGG